MWLATATVADPRRRYRAKLAHLLRKGWDPQEAKKYAAGYSGGKTRYPAPSVEADDEGAADVMGFPYESASDLPEEVRNFLPPEAQEIWLTVFNSSFEEGEGEAAAAAKAWAAVKNAGYEKNEDTGKWIKAMEWFSGLVKLAEKVSEIEILRCGTWEHPEYGKIRVNEDDLDMFIKNFNDKVRRVDLAIDQAHKPDEGAAGWFRKLVRRGASLFAQVEWTPIGTWLIENKIFRYISPEFSFKYKDDETGKATKNVLYGAALTNRPFIKGMAPVLLSEDQAALLLSEELDRLAGMSLVESPEEEVKAIMELEELRTALALGEEAGESEVQQAIATLIEKGNTVDALTAEKVALSEQLTQEQAKLAEVQAKLVEYDWRELSAKAMSEGRMTPKQEPKFKERFLRDPEGTRELVALLEPIVSFGEVGSQRGVESQMAVFNAKVQVKVSGGMQYAEAVQAVSKEEPALWAEVDRERRGK